MMGKMKFVLVAAFVLLFVSPVLASAPDLSRYVLLTVTGDKVNLRSTPPNGKVLRQSEKGGQYIAEQSEVTADDGSKWYKIVSAVYSGKSYKCAAYVSSRYANASAIPSGLVSDDSFLFTRLFSDFFLVYARREKPLVMFEEEGMEETLTMEEALTAAGYKVIYEEGLYEVDDPDNEGYYLGGFLAPNEEGLLSCLGSIEYWVAYENQGVRVEFGSSGDRYFIQPRGKVEVGSVDDLIDYFK
jgi:hypothetical protein